MKKDVGQIIDICIKKQVIIYSIKLCYNARRYISDLKKLIFLVCH